MSAPVPGKERDPASAQLAQHVVVGGRPEGRLDGGFFNGRESRHGVEAAPADDADFSFQS